jgi:hypothetical protein
MPIPGGDITGSQIWTTPEVQEEPKLEDQELPTTSEDVENEMEK